MEKQKTIFSDIDGTIIDQVNFDELNEECNILEGVYEKFKEWNELGHYIVLTTARPEEFREITENQMKSIGIEYDQLVMGIGRGKRYLINNTSPKKPDINRSIGIPVLKDGGFKNILWKVLGL